MGSTLPLDELIKHADNLYEAIIMIAKRANEINSHQKKMLDEQAEANDFDEDFDEDVVNHDYLDRQYVKMPKPTTLALAEMMEGKLKKNPPKDKEAT
jgi:DNA-directed RNA polymerase subunit K/omega